MSIRVLLAGLLSATLACVLGFLFISSRYLEARIVEILPPDFAPQAQSTIHLLIFGQFAVVIILGVIVSFIMFTILSMYIVHPIHVIIKAMAAFAENGAKLPLPQRAPKEILELERVFDNFTDKVNIAHQQDVDASRVKSDFISTAAHQLRTPLTGIRWALEALEKENLNEFQKALVKNATDKSHDLVAIVGTLLDISSIESGKYKYEFKQTDISSLVEQVTQDFAPMAQKTNVSLYYAKSQAKLPVVRVDQVRIKWVLNNLIENAIRYTPSGGTVSVTCDASQSRLYIRVRDTGIGIQPKDRANIFERFYRASNAIAKENQGNGLGLYIARTIATDHGGDLNFENNTEGPGTTFTLSLPFAS
jgi:signal transduction histidine kinase